MIKINFTEEEKAALHHERFNHPHPRVQLKMEALYLKSQGLAHKEITHLTGIDENTLRTYLTQYLEGGIERLKEINFYRPTTKLVEYKDSIENYFRENPPATINEAIAKIKDRGTNWYQTKSYTSS